MTFSEAIEALKEGCGIGKETPTSWMKEGEYYFLSRNQDGSVKRESGQLYKHRPGDSPILCYFHLSAIWENDFFVVESH